MSGQSACIRSVEGTLGARGGDATRIPANAAFRAAAVRSLRGRGVVTITEALRRNAARV